MKIVYASLAVLLIGGFAGSEAFAGPKHRAGGPPGLAKKGKTPPGLVKKGGLPPGIAKKYAVGEILPRDVYVPVQPVYRTHLPYNSPEGRQWVQAGRDLYLLSAATGTIIDVVHNWLD